MKESESNSVVSNSLRPHGLYSPWHCPGQNTGNGSLSLVLGIFPTQGPNPGLLHCTWILYQLRHQESPRILDWVAYLFSSGSSWPRDWTGISCFAGGFFTSWATREAPVYVMSLLFASYAAVFKGSANTCLRAGPTEDQVVKEAKLVLLFISLDQLFISDSQFLHL